MQLYSYTTTVIRVRSLLTCTLTLLGLADLYTSYHMLGVPLKVIGALTDFCNCNSPADGKDRVCASVRQLHLLGKRLALLPSQLKPQHQPKHVARSGEPALAVRLGYWPRQRPLHSPHFANHDD